MLLVARMSHVWWRAWETRERVDVGYSLRPALMGRQQNCYLIKHCTCLIIAYIRTALNGLSQPLHTQAQSMSSEIAFQLAQANSR